MHGRYIDVRSRKLRYTAVVNAAILAVCSLSALAPKAATAQTPAPDFKVTVFATGAAVNASSPDSLAVFGGNVFVGYANGVASDGTGGAATSTIAQYKTNGALTTTYFIVGGNDGLRVDPSTGLLWVLQNQDGNPVLYIIDPNTYVVTHYKYAGNLRPKDSGFDDVVFKGDKAYLSATNPSSPNDVVLYEANTELPKPGGTIHVRPILKAGSLVDTDALALTPNGDLLLDDQGAAAPAVQPLPSLTLIRQPGTEDQTTSQIFPKDASGKPLSLDDTRFAPIGSRQLLIADTANNVVYSLTGRFAAHGAYSATKGNHTVGRLNFDTGVVTPIVSGLGSPHGLAFVERAHEDRNDDNEEEEEGDDQSNRE